eukprot:Plantae.Rhodophyta-Purpureofilum_apyrenoidigerum.ctg4694.p2 GENE.Plantae.Rhodophyta-Purpureofilum_apyrenoidigerum.ctg4694~~Plantae.Rhodophyta-Purpureofilum_apyrenoidigerum.ctg4694.p2  ORF type:complete len:231 (-),score=33.11 Plantae.Rhodophyta-Purpureofilum_apyrenoidigerum.ctg4694:1943-2635(-)
MCEDSSLNAAGQTVFHQIALKWNSVCTDDGKVQLLSFVEAVDDFLVVFKALGSAFFTDMVKSDMRKNMEKIQTAAQKYGVCTLEEMVDNELRDNTYTESNSGTEGLLWLKRTLQFILLLLRNIATKESSTPLNECAALAYRDTLKPCHNWLLQRLFDAGMLCIPSRNSFFGDLGTSEEVVRVGMLTFIQVAARQLNPIVAYYNRTKLEALCSTWLEPLSGGDAPSTAILC